MLLFLKRFEFENEHHLDPVDAQRNVLDWINSKVPANQVVSITEVSEPRYAITVWWYQ